MKPYYEKDGITIFHGDCRDVTWSDSSLILTDPPYVIKHVVGGGIGGATPFYKQDKLIGIRDFNLCEYKQSLVRCRQIVATHSRDQIAQYAKFITESFDGYDLHVWHKVNPVPFTHNTWLPDLEYIALGWKGSKKHQSVAMKHKSKVYSSGIDTENLHPAQKPVALMTKYIAVLTSAEDLIVDPFMGVGTTLVAARLEGRKCIGIELNELYCETAANRLRQGVFAFDTN